MSNKKSLLVVDDDIAHRTMLRILLDWEYEILEADDGFTAIDKVRECSFDLVIMDVILSGRINGIEAAMQIRSRSDIPIVFITGYDEGKLIERLIL